VSWHAGESEKVESESSGEEITPRMVGDEPMIELESRGWAVGQVIDLEPQKSSVTSAYFWSMSARVRQM
jgi:hypothetical protein